MEGFPNLIEFVIYYFEIITILLKCLCECRKEVPNNVNYVVLCVFILKLSITCGAVLFVFL